MSGIIDFSDLRLDDPATDFAGFYSPKGYGKEYAQWVAQAYSSDQSLLLRAQCYAATYPLQEAYLAKRNNQLAQMESAINDFALYDLEDK